MRTEDRIKLGNDSIVFCRANKFDEMTSFAALTLLFSC